MTYDELLEEIDYRFSDTCDAHCENCSTKNFPMKALRAVVELHKPWSMETGPEGDSETETVVGCECIPQLPAFLNPWPCQTIQAIQKELSDG
jgi:hypothetical protein